MPALEFWFDYSCPYAYVASTRAAALADRLGVPLSWRPMLLGGVFAARQAPQNLAATLPVPKALHLLRDQARFADRAGVPLRHPPEHPRRTVDALRATLAAGVDPTLIAAFYRAYWAEGRPVEDRAEVLRIAAETGHPLDAAALDAQKDALRARTEEAVSLGVFGAPTWVWRDGGETRLWFGGDRTDAVEAHVRAATGQPPAPAPTPTPARPGATVDFWFDYSSPYAFLGALAVPGLEARTGATVRWRPMLLGAVFKAVAQANVPLFTFSAPKQAWTMRDLVESAARLGSPLVMNPHFPLKTTLPARLTLAHPDPVGFARRVFHATWVDGLDTTDLAVLRGLGADEILAPGSAADGPSIEAALLAAAEAQKEALFANTAEALEAGVFGAPSWVVRRPDGGPWLFWGQDRVDQVEAALGGWTPPA